MKNRFNFFLSLSLLYAVLIFYLSSQQSLGVPGALFDFLLKEYLKNILVFIGSSDMKILLNLLPIFSQYQDKIESIVLYAGFGILLYFTLKNSPNSNLRHRALIFTIIFGVLYGLDRRIPPVFRAGKNGKHMEPSG